MISSAQRLANPSANPTQEDLRLAVHASYYATFHTLSYSCADFLVGSTPDARASDEWAYAFRALDHGQVKRQCSQREIDGYHLGIQDFAEKFCELQEHRHDADYSSRARYTQVGAGFKPAPTPSSTAPRLQYLTSTRFPRMSAAASSCISWFVAAGCKRRPKTEI